MRSSARGQALLEWVILGSAILCLWAFALSHARRLLATTTAQSWSVQAARAALSGQRVSLPPGLHMKGADGTRFGRAQIWTEEFQARYEIRLPEKTKRDSSWFTSLCSGFRSSRFGG